MAMNKDFGPFELKEKIGSGGMASVYLAVQKSLNRPVVLKILYPHLAEDEKLVQRFEREARAAAMMRHENIIQVIDCGRHDDVAYICMEFVEGMDLQKWLTAHGTPPIEMALLMLRDLCRGLEHAHGHRIIHRDIKPANVMFTPDGTIKLMDFGLARSGSETSTQMTMVGSVLGTPAYMSPEQATGEVVDERSDIFSAGVVAYELLGGTRPFGGDSYSTVLRAILTVDPPDVTQFNPLVPEDVAQIVRGMLQKDVSKRYAGIGQVRQELETVIEQLGLHRGKDLLREYALDPQGVGNQWKRKRLMRHMDQGVFFENMGLGKIDDALLEFRRVLYLDPDNAAARDHVKKLERERQKLVTSATLVPQAPPAAGGETMILPPGQEPPAGGPSKPAEAKPAKPAKVPKPAKPAAPARQESAGKPRSRMPLVAGALALLAVIVVIVVMLNRHPDSGASTTEPGGSSAPAASVPEPPAATSDATPAAPGTVPQPGATTPAATPFEAARAQFDAGKFAEAAAALRHLVTSGAVQGPELRAARELRARALVRLGKAADAQKLYATLLADDATFQPDPAGLTPADRSAFDAAKAKPVKPDSVPGPSPATVTGGSGALATLSISVNPFAALAVDGENKGVNQKQYHLQLKPGHHVVRLLHPSLGPHEWSLDLEPGQTRELTYDFLASSSGSISVSSEGGWAEIYIDGDPAHHPTPWVIENVPAGKHEISLVRDGFSVEGGAKNVNVKAGEQASVSFKMKKKK
jgi:tRNA A-37 threonylcarbamoyl transferase component Bud32